MGLAQLSIDCLRVIAIRRTNDKRRVTIKCPYQPWHSQLISIQPTLCTSRAAGTVERSLLHCLCSSIHASARGVFVENALVERLGTWRDIQSRVIFKEAVGLQHHARDLCRHHWEILRPRVVREAERVPDDDIFVLDVLFALDPSLEALLAFRLVRVDARGKEFVVLVLGYPNGMFAKVATACVP